MKQSRKKPSKNLLRREWKLDSEVQVGIPGSCDPSSKLRRVCGCVESRGSGGMVGYMSSRF